MFSGYSHVYRSFADWLRCPWEFRASTELPMNVHRLSRFLASCAVAGVSHGLWGASGPSELEQNAWPYIVRQTQPVERRVDAFTAAGPLIFRKPAADIDGNTASGVRPFW